MADYQRYREAVTMAVDVFSGAPQGVVQSRPHVKDDPTGQGVSAQRIGKMRFDHLQPRHHLMEGQP